jgi:hypothetical protein
VLAINGPRKSFCIYHAASERNKPHKELGKFLGMDSDTDSENEPESEILFETDLLSRLGTWMERLCEGSIPKIRIDEWPKMV